MIYLKNIHINEDYLLEKSRDSHDTFSQKKVVYKANKYRTKNEVDQTVVYFKLFHKGLSIDFKNDISIIVGDNGCGKTSLLKLIKFKPYEPGWIFGMSEEEKKIKIEEETKEHLKQYIFGESRTLNFTELPQGVLFLDGLHKGVIAVGMKNDVDKELSRLDGGGGNLGRVAASFFSFQFHSNGEVLLDRFEGLSQIKNSLIIIDEPETSLSLKSINKMVDVFTELAKTNQLIISSHHPYFMCMVPEVYDIEKKKYTNTEKYLKSFKQHTGDE